MNIKELENLVCAAIDGEKEKAFALSDYLFDNPELGYKEHLAAKRYIELLEAEGMPVRANYLDCDTAFMATVKEDPDSDIKIGILAEYDALPEIGHACGHCASGALSYLAALALFRHRDELKGNIYLIGTPAEEVGGLKAKMAKSGQFDDFSFVIMLHMAHTNKSSSTILGITGYDFVFHGAPAHAAICPWEGRNAMNGMNLFIHAIDMMRQHVKDGTRIHGIVRNAGSATNVVPDNARCSYMWRHTQQDYIETLSTMMLDAAKGCAMATGTQVDCVMTGTSMTLKPTPYANGIISGIYKELGIEEDHSAAAPFGSSDIGALSWRCPAFQPLISVSDAPVAIHTKEFADCMLTDKTRWAIERGAKTIALLVLRSMFDPAIIAGMKADFNN